MTRMVGFTGRDGGVGLSPTPPPNAAPPPSLLPHQPCRRCRTTDWDAFGAASSLLCRRCLRVAAAKRQQDRDEAAKWWAIGQGLPRCSECGLYHKSAAMTEHNPFRLCVLCQRDVARGVDMAPQELIERRGRGPRPYQHGTAACYRGRGCRCIPCREAHTVWMRGVRARLAA